MRVQPAEESTIEIGEHTVRVFDRKSDKLSLRAVIQKNQIIAVDSFECLNNPSIHIITGGAGLVQLCVPPRQLQDVLLLLGEVLEKNGAPERYLMGAVHDWGVDRGEPFPKDPLLHPEDTNPKKKA